MYGLYIARKIIGGRRGTRFVQVSLGGWDMHSNIYAKTGTSLYSVAPQLDKGFAALLEAVKEGLGD